MVEGQITLREATAEDTPFLARLYTDIRRPEVAGWGWSRDQQDSFLRMQFDAQCRSYRIGFPEASDRIIQIDDEPVGRMLIHHDAASLHLIDIGLLAQIRNSGIGSYLLSGLQDVCQARGCPLRLQVTTINPAKRLYQRLGFLQISADPMYAQMEWIPLQDGKVFDAEEIKFSGLRTTP